ncbi:kinase-like domain-containing protein [Cristinia sonorae]|uniref:Kinase-like domain-containing protein n=1 Tax=Cristinia sonorae TaxID=1940300 RepID=A0A8K0UQP8_9AGAR|nr:kinase-like domain-containing protein [Cristinia sonorae]
MFPLLRKRSKKSKDNITPPTESIPALPAKPLTTSGFSVPARPLVHRHVRGLPISPPFSKVEFRHRTSPTSPTDRYRFPSMGAAANLSDGTTLANSPNSILSPLSSESEHGMPASPSSYDKASAQYYDADDGSGPESSGRDFDDRVSYHRWNSSSDSVDPRFPSEHPSRASTGSSMDHTREHRKSSSAPASSQMLSVYVDPDNYVPQLEAPPQPKQGTRNPRRPNPLRRVGILRWENDLDGIIGQQKLWVHIYEQDDEDMMIVVDRIPVTFPPEMEYDPYNDPFDLTQISRPLPYEVEHRMEPRAPGVFQKQAEELDLYRKELEYIAAIPSASSRGPIRPIGIVSPAMMRKPVPCRDLPDAFQWTVTQRNIINVRHSLVHKKWYTGSVLGEGTFGRVYLVYNVPHRAELAMKVVYIKRPMSKIVCEGLVNELRVFERLVRTDAQKAVFVMTPSTSTGLWAWQSTEGFLHITSQFCPGGDLYEYIGHLSPDQLRLIVAELVLGIESLHQLGIVHHDLKPENVLVDEDGHCVIADYGGSKFLSEGLLIRKTKDEVICTLPYAAPELLADSAAKYRPYDEAIDYWALGATIFMLATGDELFSGEAAEVKQKQLCIANTLGERLRGCPSDLIDLTSSLLTLDPAQRLRGAAVRTHPYLAPFKNRWSDIAQKRLGSPIPYVRNVGGHARGYSIKCKNWPSKYAAEGSGGPKTAYLPNVLAKEGLELPYDESFDVPMEHHCLINA